MRRMSSTTTWCPMDEKTLGAKAYKSITEKNGTVFNNIDGTWFLSFDPKEDEIDMIEFGSLDQIRRYLEAKA